METVRIITELIYIIIAENIYSTQKPMEALSLNAIQAKLNVIITRDFTVK
jgi:hypothetical protein